jgi:hypothetical protein
MELRSRVIGNKKRHLEEESESDTSEEFVALIELDYDEVMDRLFPPSTPQIPENQIGQFIEGFKKYQESYLKEKKKTTKKAALRELQMLYNNRLHTLRIELLSNKRRRATSSAATAILKAWMTEHVSNPYPTSTELAQLMTETGLSALQISNWMI